MSSGVLEPKDGLEHQVAPVATHQSDVIISADLMDDAVQGENREHNMGMWQAVKDHPWACFWAFTMSFTIVSFPISIA